VRQLDVEADAEAAAVLAAAVRSLHRARPAAGDHRPARLGEELSRRACRLIRRRTVDDAGGAEDRDRRPVDPLDRLEPLVELLRDAGGVLAQRRLILVRLGEKLAVLHYRPPSGCVASMPITRSAASPR